MKSNHHAPIPSDIAFTPTVKAIQSEKGSRDSYAKIELGYGWETTVTLELSEFLAGLDTFFLELQTPSANLTFNIEAARRAFYGSSTTRRWASPTLEAIASTLRLAISKRIPKPLSSPSIFYVVAESNSGERRALWKVTPSLRLHWLHPGMKLKSSELFSFRWKLGT